MKKPIRWTGDATTAFSVPFLSAKAVEEQLIENAEGDDSGVRPGHVAVAAAALVTAVALAGAYKHREAITDWLVKTSGLSDAETKAAISAASASASSAEYPTEAIDAPGYREVSLASFPKLKELLEEFQKFSDGSGLAKARAAITSAKTQAQANDTMKDAMLTGGALVGTAGILAAAWKYRAAIASGASSLWSWIKDKTASDDAGNDDDRPVPSLETVALAFSGKERRDPHMEVVIKAAVDDALNNARALLSARKGSLAAIDPDKFQALTFLCVDKLNALVDDDMSRERIGWKLMAAGAAIAMKEPFLIGERHDVPEPSDEVRSFASRILGISLDAGSAFGLVRMSNIAAMESISLGALGNPLADKESLLSSYLVLEQHGIIN